MDPKNKTQSLIFVYNADSGIRNGLLDIAHKILRPDSYECALCDLTFGIFKERSLWKKFRRDQQIKMEFLHKDEFLRSYGSKWIKAYTYPIILEATAHELEIFLNTAEIKELSSTEALIGAIKSRIV